MTQLIEQKTQALQVWFEQNPALAARGIDESTWNSLCSSVYPGAKPDSILMAVDYCAARNLDIMLKPVHLVPMSVKNAQTGQSDWRDVPMPGIGMYRIQAARSGNVAGIDEPEFGPMVTQEFRGKNNTKVTVNYPEWCKVTVHKIIGDRVVSYSAKEYWLENYATEGRDSEAPNTMWKKRPRGQIAKCAEAQALRKGWPEIDQGQTAEEMEGKFYGEVEINPMQSMQTLEKPKSKTSLKDMAKAASAPAVEDEPEFDAPILSPAGQKQANRLIDCQSADDLNAWAADATAKFPPEHPDSNELGRLYSERWSQIGA